MNPSYKEQAIPLITYNSSTRKYSVNQDTVQIIKQIPKPIAVISVAGAYRTGKSYLLNRLLLNKSGGFGVGPTVNPCTKGIWVWGTPIKGQTQDGESINILVMDSEGIGSTEEDNTHDVRIFSLSILLSSTFIYNSMSSIDENAISNLSFVSNLTKNIHFKSTNSQQIDQEDYAKYFPNFFWVLRDFTLQLVDHQNQPMTPNQYLERSLQEQKGFSDDVEQKNRTRRLLTTFFPQRECITLIRPLLSESNLQKLDKMGFDQLRPEFFEQVIQFRKKLLQKSKPKKLNGKHLSGEMLMNLCENYINSINNGAVPSIENGWVFICRDECNKGSLNSFDVYEKYLRENLFGKIPTTIEEIKHQHKTAKNLALEVFQNRTMGDVGQQYLDELNSKIKARIQQIITNNEKEASSCCLGFIQREFVPIDKKLQAGQYENFGEFEKDVKFFYQFLIEHGPNTVNRHTFFLDFLQKMINEGASYFIQNLQSTINNEKNISGETLKKSDIQLQQIKVQLAQERENYIKQIEFLNKEKEKISVQKQFNEKSVKQIEFQKNQIEKEYKEQIENTKNELQEEVNKLKQQLKINEESLKKQEREIVLKESMFGKEKALFEHKANHFESICKEMNAKEVLNQALFQQKISEVDQQSKEMALKSEKMAKEYQLKVNNLKEQNTELSEKVISLEQKQKLILSSNQNKENLQKKQIEDQQLEIAFLKKQISEQSNSGLRNIGDLKQQFDEEFKEIKHQYVQLQQELQKNQQKSKQEQGQFKQKEALFQQQKEFLNSEVEELKIQLLELKKSNQATLNALEIGQYDNNSGVNEQYLNLKEAHCKQIKQLESEFLLQKKTFLGQIDSLSKDLADLGDKSKQNIQEFEIQVQQMSAQIEEYQIVLEEKEGKYTQIEEMLKVSLREGERKYLAKIKMLEEIIEQVKEKSQFEVKENQQKSEEILQHLKNMFEVEREILEKRLVEEKEKREKNYNLLVEEYESKLRDEQFMFEEEIENLREDVREYEKQIAGMQGQFEHEMDLKDKSIENLENSCSELKQQIKFNQNSFQNQLEQQQYQSSNERKEIQNKYDEQQRTLQLNQNQILSLTQKLEHFESSYESKKKECIQQKQDFNIEKQLLDEKCEELRKKQQEISDQYLQNKIISEKNLALSQQKNDFFQKKVNELEQSLDFCQQKSEEKINALKALLTQETSEKIQSLLEEKNTIESKLISCKKAMKENEQQTQKIVSELEKESAILTEKLQSAENKLKQVEEKYLLDTEQLREQLNKIKEITLLDKKALSGELERVKLINNQLDNEKHELYTHFERDKVLWEGKFNYLQQQKEQSKLDLIESQKKFEQTLGHIQKTRQSEKQEREQNISEMLISIENKYQTQITEINENFNCKLQQAGLKITKLEAELKNNIDQGLYEQRQKNTNAAFAEKRLIEYQENEKKLQQIVEILRVEKENEKMDFLKKIEAEKEGFRGKNQAIEEKLREAEKKRNLLIFEQEKQRAKWIQEKDYLINQKNEIQENFNIIEKKKEILLRENERIRNDFRQQKRNNQNGTSFMHMNRHVYTESKSPMRSVGRSKERVDTQEYNYNNSIDTLEDNINSEPILNSGILENIMLNNSNNQNMQKGFKSFMEKMQEKSFSSTTINNENQSPISVVNFKSKN